MERYPQGRFCWADAGAQNVEGACAFYQALFGWTSDERKTPMGSYVVQLQDGKPCAALHGVPPHISQPQWLCYVAVDDARAATQRAESLGAQILMPVYDANGQGLMSVINDPGGATLALWQATGMPGTEVESGPGSLAWVELRSRAAEACRKFYEALFGWSFEKVQVAPGFDYFYFSSDGARRGGMFQMGPEFPEGLPSLWTPYFGHRDADEAARIALERGGRVPVPPREIPGANARFAVLHDPEMTTFAVLTRR